MAHENISFDYTKINIAKDFRLNTYKIISLSCHGLYYNQDRTDMSKPMQPVSKTH